MSACPFCGTEMSSEAAPCPHCGNRTSFWRNGHKDKLPQVWGPFIIEKNNFEYRNQKHDYQAIQHINYDTLKTKTILGFMPVWESETSNIDVYLDNTLVIKEKCKTLSSMDKKATNLYAAYKYLSEVSFTSRFNLYAKTINTEGYFHYDGSKFYTDGHIETRNQQNLYLKDWTIANHGSFFQLTPRDPSVLDKIGQGLSSLPTNAALWKKRFHSDLTIHTTMDKDVFYSLMLRIYNIQFPFNTALSK